MTYPTIKHLNDLLPFIQANPQFRVDKQANGMTVVCYMLQDETTFSGENEQYSKECRGITFNPDGTIAARTLHKFENVGQSPASQPDLIPWDRIVRIMDKRDGSMITPVLMPDGTIKCKTKKTFTSNEAIAATEFLHQIIDGDQPYLEWVRIYLQEGITPTFEWTSPRFPIVLTYEKDELTLLHLRVNETGEYLPAWAWSPLTSGCPFPIVENLLTDERSPLCVKEDPRTLLELAKTATGIEGWIIQADDGDMWKIKTKWYCDLHHSVTFTRWRDVAKLVAQDQSDDLKAAFAMTGRSIEPILEVERKVQHMITHARVLTENTALVGKHQGWDAKTMALHYKGHELFGQIMRRFRDQPIDWLEWYRKNHIDSWSLDVIPTVTQNEDTEET